MTARRPRVRADSSSRGTTTATLPTLDLAAYARTFEQGIVPAYQGGTADEAWPVDLGLAHSIIPPGTAATRDFSRLAPTPAAARRRAVRRLHGLRQRLPRQRAHRDGRPRGRAGPADRPVRRRSGDRCGRAVGPAGVLRADEEVRGHPGAKRRRRRAHSACSSSRRRCKGCGECVEVCTAAGHDALFMRDKDDVDGAGIAGPRPGERGHPVPADPAADTRGLSQRQGARRHPARRPRLRLRRRRRLLRRLRRGDGDPDDGRRHPRRVRPGRDGDRRGDGLQHGLRQHLPVQPVPRALDEFALRECAGGRQRDPAPDGTRRAIRTDACG